MKFFLPICLVAAGCVATPLMPVEVRKNEDACAHCRMTLVSISTAAQIVTPGEDPLIFDELACLRDYLASHTIAGDARIFVADHRTGSWIEATSAVFTKTSMTTPMASGLIAHSDASSRDADDDARGGTPLAASDILFPARVNP